MKNQLRSYLLNERINVDDLINLIKGRNEKEVLSIIEEVSWLVSDNNNLNQVLAIYGMLCYMIQQSNSAIVHLYCDYIWTQPFCAYAGAFEIGTMHLKIAYEIDSDNFDVLIAMVESILHPDSKHLFSEFEIKEVVTKLSKKDINSYVGSHVYNSYKELYDNYF